MKPEMLTLAENVSLWNEVDNVGVLDLGDCGAVIDTHEDISLKEKILRFVNQCLNGKPVRYVLNTHLHYDHTVLNRHFESQGAKMVSLKTFPEGTLIKGKNFSIRMIPIPGCHSDTDAMFWVAECRILFTGDIFGWGLVPWEPPLTAEKIELIDQTYRKFIGLDPEQVVPGHGPVCRKPHLERWLRYFHDMLKDAADLRTAGVAAAEAATRLKPPEDMGSWWRFNQWKHDFTRERVINYVYRR